MIDAVTTAYVGMQQAQQQQDVSTAVLRSSLDMVTEQGDSMSELIQGAGAAQLSATESQIAQGLAITDPAMGGEIDFLV